MFVCLCNGLNAANTKKETMEANYHYYVPIQVNEFVKSSTQFQEPIIDQTKQIHKVTTWHFWQPPMP